MIGKLVFKLPEEREDFEMSQKAWEYRFVIEEVLNELRKRYKYENQEVINIEELRKIIYDNLEERKLDVC